MTGFIYNLILHLASALLSVAGMGSRRLAAFVKGRYGLVDSLRQSMTSRTGPVIWIHCPSLGEFEQGRTVIDGLRSRFPGHIILLTFFSPSGYEIRRGYPGADIVTYLPFDTRDSVRDFISVARPELLILIKYDFWPNLLFELEEKGVPVIAVSSIFRQDQVYFQWYGSFFLRAIMTIDRFFLQDQTSVRLLGEHQISETEVTGDTRFDRVVQVVNETQPVPEVEIFAKEHTCWVIGSAWPEDMTVISPLISSGNSQERFIVVPHQVDEQSIAAIEQHCHGKSIRWSQLEEMNDDISVMIIDRIGLLSRVYRYATYAWIGGGFGKGLHNILEAAAYGKPVFFGSQNYKKFREAEELIDAGGAWAVADHAALQQCLESLSPASEGYKKACSVSYDYVRNNTGATEKIVVWCSKLLGA